MGRGCPLVVSEPGQEEEASGRPLFITSSPTFLSLRKVPMVF